MIPTETGVIYLGFTNRIIRLILTQNYSDDLVGETLVDYFCLCRYSNFAQLSVLNTFMY